MSTSKTWRLVALVSVCWAVPFSVGTSHATPEQDCHKGRYTAAAKFLACEAKATAGFQTTGDVARYLMATSKCRTKYDGVWSRLRSKAAGTGSTCDSPRLVVHGDGTVTDRQTALQWERKTDDGGLHDKDDDYTWSSGVEDADGTVFTTFLAALNTAPCFAGHCDWRLPTRTEMQTLFAASFPCTMVPACIDQTAFPITAAVPTHNAGYWTATTWADDSSSAWKAFFDDGAVLAWAKSAGGRVRAVRGGL